MLVSRHLRKTEEREPEGINVKHYQTALSGELKGFLLMKF